MDENSLESISRLAHRLSINLSSLEDVLDGEWGKAKNEVEQDVVIRPELNERLMLIQQSLTQSIEFVQGFRERLQRITEIV